MFCLGPGHGAVVPSGLLVLTSNMRTTLSSPTAASVMPSVWKPESEISASGVMTVWQSRLSGAHTVILKREGSVDRSGPASTSSNGDDGDQVAVDASSFQHDLPKHSST